MISKAEIGAVLIDGKRYVLDKIILEDPMLTTQQIALLVMAVSGVVLFFAGRFFAAKCSSGKASFIPASLITLKGIIVYLSFVASWAGVLIAVVCIWFLFS